MKTVLIIAGSDPGAGAGLQQDLKVATLLGTYGLTVVTALTVQNSCGVRAVHPVAPEVVAAQLEAVTGDFPVHAIKIGMLGTAAVAAVVAGHLKGMKEVPPVVLDPVLAAGHGQPLLEETAYQVLREELFPLTHILTPNVSEAGRFTGMAIQTVTDLEDAARRLQKLGPQWVLAKGGHLPGEPVDVLTDGKNAYHLSGVRLTAPHHHGSGCLMATALAAHLARGRSVPEAVTAARSLVQESLRWGLPLGQGVGPVNPYAPFARKVARYEVLESLKAAARRLQEDDFAPLMPERMSNLAYAVPYAAGPQDVAAFPGGLVKSMGGMLIPSPPAFGASEPLAAVILAAVAAYPELRAALNGQFIPGLERLAPLLNFLVVTFDRTQAPPGVKIREADLLSWGVKDALKELKSWQGPPDIIQDGGDWGKEPQCFILGTDPHSVAEKALALKNALQAAGRLKS